MTKGKLCTVSFAGTALLLLVLGVLCTKTEVSMAGSEATRFGVIHALAEQGVFYFNNTEFRTVDKVVIEGRLYSDKPLLLPLIGAVVYKAVNFISGLNFHDNYHLTIYLVNLIMFATVNLLTFTLFWRKIMPMKGSLALKIAAAAALCCGSWVFTYSVTMNNHTPSALMLWLWFILLDDFDRKRDCALLFLAGIAAGTAANLEIPQGALAGLAGIPVVWKLAGKERRIPALTAYCGAVAGMALFFAALNYIAYGTVIPLYLAGNTGTYAPGTDMKYYPEYIFEVLAGRRGLFSHQPFVLFVLPFLCRSYWKRLRPAEQGAAGLSLAVIVFYIVMTNEYGGWAYGFRYLVAILPLLWYLALRFLGMRRRSWRTHLAVYVLLLWGVVTSFAGAYEPFCVAFEGYRTKPGHASYEVRSSFCGNLLSRSFRNDPDGLIAQFMIKNIYGERVALKYLWYSYQNIKDFEAMNMVRNYAAGR